MVVGTKDGFVGVFMTPGGVQHLAIGVHLPLRLAAGLPQSGEESFTIGCIVERCPPAGHRDSSHGTMASRIFKGAACEAQRQPYSLPAKSVN